MSREQAEKLKIADVEQLHISQGQGTAILPLRLDSNAPMGCVSIPCGIEAVKNLGAAFGSVELEKLS